ncbi:S8 family serine peptidase [Pedobacter cryoconitis]|uniref:Subtilase family protein n=1 Tax=Pedobacter cryoconitis TaxID=188932 RepID=A0A327T0M9_9SPHI|nr:S8 family serine peptidase [Pedobacter cryoconitis]RAJ34312.1 subtilase family protein [Pedobacter cryoconitis]
MIKTDKYFIQLVMIAFMLFAVNSVFAQTDGKIKANWQNLDLKTDSVFGISMEKAYTQLLSGKKETPVIVAVIDGGVDINHEDLKSVIWTNLKEIPGNGIDDDKNGFIDDIHGWNFYSAAVGEDTQAEILSVHNKIEKTKRDQEILNHMLQKMCKPIPTIDDFKNYVPGSPEELKMQTAMITGLKIYPDFVSKERVKLKKAADFYKMQLAYYEKKDYDPIPGGPSSIHGTHVAGIIAAVRNNNVGTNGVADQVKLMVIRATPGIDPFKETADSATIYTLGGTEENKNIKAIADAIHYAADNGAKVINMSFGIPLATRPATIYEAIRYAVSKDILIVHAAGNTGENLDKMDNLIPDRKTLEGQVIAPYWIEVGASDSKNDQKLATEFSNYGKNSVDVYAPGVDITSTVLRSTYDENSGTSMAAPVVTGLAAVIREYYPKLRAVQVKEVIMKSVVHEDVLKDKCVSGGVVNAYNALSSITNY